MSKNLFLRLIAMLLIVIMMGTMIISCDNGGDAQNPEEPSNNTQDTPSGEKDPEGKDDEGKDTDDGTEVKPPVDEDEAVVDMDGYEFTALARQTEWFANEVTADPDTGDQILQAVYDRNWAVEEKYNCIMSQYFVSESEWTTWRNAVNTGEGTYKYSLNHMLETGTEALSGTMLNLKLLPNINLDAQYWNQSVNKEFTIGNKLYFTANEFCTSSVYFTWLMLFNMKMCEERGIDVYKMIEDGTWTIDQLYSIAAVSYEDDGDGVVEFTDDTFGIVSYNTTVLTNYIFAFDIPVMHLDANGKAVVDFNEANTPMVTAVEKVYDLFYNSANGGILMTDAARAEGIYSGLSHDDAIVTKLSTGQALFVNARILALETLRTADITYGIIPFPKYNETQSGYYSHVDGRASLLFVPYTLAENEYENVGLLLEVLAKKTKEDVMPVIQSAALIGRYSEDSNAYKCLEMTLEGRTYAFSYVFNSVLKSSRPYWTMVDIIKNGNNNFSDHWRSKSRVAEREINSIIQQYVKANK